MPIARRLNDKGKSVVYYEWPLLGFDWPEITDGLLEFLKQLRRDAVKQREEFDKTGVKDAAKFQRHVEKACTLVIADLWGPSGPSRPDLWPTELAEALDYVTRAVILFQDPLLERNYMSC